MQKFLSFCLLCTQIFFGTFVVAVKHDKIQSDIGKNFSIKCPEKQGVYGVEVEFIDEYLAKPKPFHEWKWTIYCRPFVPEGEEDKGDEDCSDKAAVPIAFNELVYEDSGMNCDCNEYLSGITGKIDTEKYHGEADQQRRMISLRCCKKKTNFIEIRTCEMVGPKTLYFPEGPVKFWALKDWDVEPKFEFPKFFVTGVSIYDGMMMVQQCRFAVDKIHKKKAKELKKKIKDAKCDFFYMRDMMNDYSKIKKCEDVPVGWPRPMVMSNQDPAMWGTLQSLGYKYFNVTTRFAPDALLFSDQFTMCADGQIIYSVSKYVRFSEKEQKKDYIFLAKCAEFEKQPCMCKWNATCDEKNWNKTCADDDGDDTAKCQKYWSGFKSQYVKKTNQRKFEIFCCTSSSINFVDCNWTRWQNDTDVKMILPKPRIKSYSEGGVGDVVGFRDFRVKWEGKNMLVQYNVCNTNDSGSPGCHYPCFPKLEMEKPKTLSDGPDGDGLGSIGAVAAAAAGITTTPKLSTQPPTTKPTTTATTTTSKASTTTTTTTSTTTTSTTTQKGCGPFDFALLLDRSVSLTPTGFNWETTFLNSFLKYFDLNPSAGNNQSRASLIVFGDTAVPFWDLTKYQNDPNANVNMPAAIKAIPYLKGSTDIYDSFYAAGNYFKASPARSGVQQVTLLVTDGVNNIPNTWTTAETKANLQQAVKDLTAITGGFVFGAFATSEGLLSQPDFNFPPGDSFYTYKYSGLPPLVPQIVDKLCRDNRANPPK